MTPNEFGKIMKSDMHGIFLFYGEEQYLKQHYLNQSKKAVSADGQNIINISGDGQSLQNICIQITEKASMPSMDIENSKRFIYIYDIEWKKTGSDDFYALEICAKEIKDYDDVTVIIDTRPETFDAGSNKRPSKLFSSLSKTVQCVNFAKESPAKIASWLQRHFAAYKISADINICNTIVNYCGRDMTLLNNEAAKLAGYVLQNGRNSITEEDIYLVCSCVTEFDTFAFSNAILNEGSESSLSIINDMKRRKESPEMILGSIIRVYSDLYTIKALLENGIMKAEIAQKTKMHEYKAGLYIQKAKNLSKNGLEKAISLCREADVKIKSTALDSYNIIEVLIIKLAMTGKIR